MDARTKPEAGAEAELVYAPMARALHWLTALAVAIMIPAGLYMVWRGNATNFDATSNALYATHKLVGFIVLWLVVARLIYRFAHGAPADEPTLEWWQKAAAHATHWGLYALLLAMPLAGWLGVTLYGALDTVGGLNLPAIPGRDALYGLAARLGSLVRLPIPAATASDADKSTLVFALHYWGAMLMLLAIAAHVGAAFYHHVIRGDGVLRRMLPGLQKRGG